MRYPFLVIICSLFLTNLNAQRKIENASDILQEIKKLKVLSNVLYIAAHPDDENTRLIAWLENEKLCRTAYLSLTRGDGGQNLIGAEKGDAMGVLRTQELLEARKIDGAEQFFSRASDFGYSKTAKETLEIWDRKGVLADVVWTIRKFRPDVIITRFPPDERAGHGHHTASAMLAEVAFEKAGDENAFPEQLKYVEPWQAKRILWNTSVWWDNQLPEKAAKANEYIKIDIGAYNQTLGLSYSEIASDSRSQHKSQGFGSSRSRGSQIEYLKHSKGDRAKDDLFDGIKTNWSRVEGAKQIPAKIDAILANFKADQASKSVPALVELYGEIESLKANPYQEEKLESLKNIIKAAAGIYVEFLADEYNYPEFESINLKGEASFISRTNVPIEIESVYPELDSNIGKVKLEENKLYAYPFQVSLALHNSHPYWLIDYEKLGEVNMANIQFDESNSKEEQLEIETKLNTKNPILRDPENHGLPMNRPVLTFNYTLNIAGKSFKFEQDIDYKWTDRVDGELHRDVIISPSITANPSKKVYLFTDQKAQELSLLITCNKDSINGPLKPILAEGWKAEPAQIPLQLKKGEQISVSFKLSPPEKPSDDVVNFEFDGRQLRSVQNIDYEHIKPQVLFPKAQIKVVRLQLNSSDKTIGYIKGSGDEVAENLDQIGYKVISFNAQDLPLMDLSLFETIIVGIRAYNTEESLINGNAILNDFVERGGNLIVQYNTNRGLKTDKIGPLSFSISRNRVTKEDAEVSFIDPNHPILNQPNKLDKSDFDGWVQERGLYFADQWDPAFQPILSWNDPGEEPQKGGLIVADYGKGHFIYTGISFFRQLPAGVPGAYRLLSNLISYGDPR